jgi:hypothetical protein
MLRFRRTLSCTDWYFEIQARTICQHAWADVEHSLSYKQDAELGDATKRRVFRLTSLLEICDDEFDTVNAHLLSLAESRAFVVLHCVEGKFYKYAKRAYDRDLSIETIGNLVDRLGLAVDFKAMCLRLGTFLEENAHKIEQIFTERRHQLEKDYYLSQPEVLFIWYLIQHHQYDLIPAWKEDCDLEDLRDLSIMWGVPITLPE